MPIERISSPVTWYGGKSRLAKRIISYFPPHEAYLEPFGGSMAVLLNKPPCRTETYNDIHKGLASLFLVIRDPDLCEDLRRQLELTLYSRAEFDFALEPSDDPVEAARRFIVRQRQSFGGLGFQSGSWSYIRNEPENRKAATIMRWDRLVNTIRAVHERIRNIQIECCDFREAIRRYDHPDTLIYCDPPYVQETRGKNRYKHEMTLIDHADLVELLLDAKGMVVLSGYRHDAYLPLERAGWRLVEIPTRCYALPGCREYRRECLWISPNIKKPSAATDGSDERNENDE